jgi:hypothetical protein
MALTKPSKSAAETRKCRIQAAPLTLARDTAFRKHSPACCRSDGRDALSPHAGFGDKKAPDRVRPGAMEGRQPRGGRRRLPWNCSYGEGCSCAVNA